MKFNVISSTPYLNSTLQLFEILDPSTLSNVKLEVFSESGITLEEAQCYMCGEINSNNIERIFGRMNLYSLVSDNPEDEFVNSLIENFSSFETPSIIRLQFPLSGNKTLTIINCNDYSTNNDINDAVISMINKKSTIDIFGYNYGFIPMLTSCFSYEESLDIESVNEFRKQYLNLDLIDLFANEFNHLYPGYIPITKL